jgi:hypothetical protein
MSDAIISLGGGAGTLQEICVAYRMQRPIVLLTGFGGWTDRLAQLDWLDERQLVPFHVESSPEGAVKTALELVREILPQVTRNKRARRGSTRGNAP